MFTPSYITAYQTGRLADSIEKSSEILENCRLCPRNCEVNRLKGKTDKDFSLIVVGLFFLTRP